MRVVFELIKIVFSLQKISYPTFQVKVWFQNRRMKWRHQESKERREQERAAAQAAQQHQQAAAGQTTPPKSTRPLDPPADIAGAIVCHEHRKVMLHER